jgi:type IV secretory pathway VirB6-like protein
MNNNPEFASNWKGRVLCQIIAEPTEKPLAKQQKIEDDVIGQAAKAKAMKKYSVIGQIGQAVALPSKNKYNIKMIFGGYELLFKPFDQRNPSNYKRYDKSEQMNFEAPFVNPEDFGFLIV